MQKHEGARDNGKIAQHRSSYQQPVQKHLGGVRQKYYNLQPLEKELRFQTEHWDCEKDA